MARRACLLSFFVLFSHSLLQAQSYIINTETQPLSLGLIGPNSIASPATGGFYYVGDNQIIWKIFTDGLTTPTVPLGLASNGLTLDKNGVLYSSDRQHRVLKSGANGNFTVIAGTGTSGYTGDGSAANQARISDAYGLAFDSKGNLYFADYGNNVVRKVDTNGIITTFAGNGTSGYTGDGGQATAATLSGPVGIAIDANDNLYVSEYLNCTVRKVNTSGVISTFAGTGGSCGISGDGGQATAAKLTTPWGMVFDAGKNLLIGHYNAVRRVSPQGVISTIAGGGTASPGNGGPATSARLGQVAGISIGANGLIYITDQENGLVRTLTPPLPSLVATPSSLTFNYTPGGAVPPSQTLAISSSGTALTPSASVTVSKPTGGTWLASTAATGSTPVNLTISVSPATLTAGTYDGFVRITAAGAYNTPLDVPVTLNVGCAFAVNPTSRNVASTGGTATYAVTTDSSCSWSVTGVPAWALCAPLNGSGSGNISCTVGPNATSAARTSTLSIGGQGATLTQDAPPTPGNCTLTANISGTPVTVLSSGGAGNIAVGATNGCNWVATSNAAWLVITAGYFGTGNGVIQWSAAANSDGASRTATITIRAGNQLSQNYIQSGASAVSLAVSASLNIALPGVSRAPASIVDSGLANIARRDPIPSNTPVAAGSNVRYSFSVTNRGNANAPGVVVAGIFDTALTGVTCTIVTGGTCTLGNGTFSAAVGALGSGQTTQVIFQAVVPAGTAAGKVLVTSAQATSSSGNTTPEDALVSPSLVVVASNAAVYTVAASNLPSAGGSILLSPASADGRYVTGTSLIVTAVPAIGYQFTGFSGDLSGGTNDQTLAVTAPRTVRANYSVVANANMRFVPLTPCRVLDTRNAAGPFGGPSLAGGGTRDFPVTASACNVPSTALAYSFNVTVVPKGQLGYLSLWPTGQPQPYVSTLNSLDGRVKANAAIVPAGNNGGVRAYATDNTELVLDINGYFVPAATSSAGLAFYPVTPCRVVDTRNTNGTFGGPSLVAGGTRTFPIPTANCGIPANAQAFSLNMTAVPRGFLGYLTTWPAGQSQPVVSTLNSPTGSVVANAALVPAGSGGAINVFVTDASDVVIDVNGYFAPTGGANPLSFYAVNPCRVADTRNPTGTFGGPQLSAGGQRTFPVPSSACGIPTAAQAYVMNATVVPPGPLGYLTLYPGGGAIPYVSTLNSPDGSIVANAALVPAGSQGLGVFAIDATHVVLDINGYFAP